MIPDQEILKKMQALCAAGEKCQYDIERKLADKYSIYGERADQIIAELIVEGFINEERYAKAYAGGKLRMNKWGKRKIIAGLKHKKISDYSIKAALSSLKEEEYLEIMKKVMQSKIQIKGWDMNDFAERNKLIRYGIGKGYSYDEIERVLKV